MGNRRHRLAKQWKKKNHQLVKDPHKRPKANYDPKNYPWQIFESKSD